MPFIKKLPKKTSFKDMSFKERIEHIQYYYTQHIAISILCIAVISFGVSQCVAVKSIKTYAKLSYYDCPYDEAAAKTLEEAIESSGLIPEGFILERQDYLFSENDQAGNNATTVLFSLEAASSNLDLIISTQDKFQNLVEGEYCLALDTVYCAVELVGDGLTQKSFVFGLDGVPYGFSLRESRYFRDLPDDYVIFIFARSPHTENALELLDFIFNNTTH